MSSPTGIKMNWPLVAIAFAVIGVPMGVAVIEDLGKDEGDEEILARIGQVGDIAEEDSVTAPELEEADDIAGRWQEPAMEQAFFDEVFLGDPDDTGIALRESDLSRWPKARIELGAGTATVTFPDDGTAEKVLENRWGKPLLMVGTDDLSRRIWTDGDTQLRLVLEQHDGTARATFSPCIPAAQYIGYNGRFAFETTPILGATPAALAAKYGARFALEADGKTGRLDCPGVEVSERRASCEIGFEHGKAAMITIVLDHLFDPDGGPHLFSALRDRLGPVRDQSSDPVSNTWRFDHGYSITQHAGQANIWIQRTIR